MQTDCSIRSHQKSCLDLVPEIVFQWLLWCIVVTDLLHLQENVAPAIAATTKVCFVRTAVTRADRSERQLTALHVDMCMAQRRSIWIEAHANISIRGGGSRVIAESR